MNLRKAAASCLIRCLGKGPAFSATASLAKSTEILPPSFPGTLRLALKLLSVSLLMCCERAQNRLEISKVCRYRDLKHIHRSLLSKLSRSDPPSYL